MLSDYLIRCGVILQFVPPGAIPAISEPLPINPPAVIRQVGYQEEEPQKVPELDEHTIRQLIELHGFAFLFPPGTAGRVRQAPSSIVTSFCDWSRPCKERTPGRSKPKQFWIASTHFGSMFKLASIGQSGSVREARSA